MIKIFEKALTPWLWPRVVRHETTVSIRFGRVVHWSLVGLAAILMGVGLAVSVLAHQAHETSLAAFSEWKSKPRDITVTLVDGSTHIYKNAPTNVTPEQAEARAKKDFGQDVVALDGGRKLEDAPVATPMDPEAALYGALVAFLLVLIGRVVRYVLAAE